MGLEPYPANLTGWHVWYGGQEDGQWGNDGLGGHEGHCGQSGLNNHGVHYEDDWQDVVDIVDNFLIFRA